MMSDPIYLSTGINSLDNLLFADNDTGGILLNTRPSGQLYETPVILIEGTTGVGKTTLALQIAFSIIRQADWRVFFYSIEQTRHALQNVAKSFGWVTSDKGGFNDLSEYAADQDGPKIDSGMINLFHFSPHPLEEVENSFVFNQRKSELQHVINEICVDRFTGNKENFHPFFILDSLTAFANRNLSRNEMYQLFSIFRANNIPVIMTVEQYGRFTSEQDTISLECAKFLADIVIELTRDNSDYFKYQLEIIKSKIGRQGLGKHLYKIRTKPYAESIAGDNHDMGIVLYPSIHYVLSTTRKKKTPNTGKFHICNSDANENTDDLYGIFHQSEIDSGSCIGIVGPAGTHKLALAVNIAAANTRIDVNSARKKVLILNFGNTSDFKFGGIAWTKNNQLYKKLSPKTGASPDRIKFWHDEYHLGDPNMPIVTVTTFRMGELTSEECFDVIEKKITENATNGVSPYSAVVLTSTVEICTSFPQLAKDPLFLPSMVELFSTQKIVSVCICVKTDHSHSIEAANLAILAKANYRIYLSHFPTTEQLSEILVKPDKMGYSGINEQLISLIVDNVSGRNYVRAPRWLSINQSTRTLRCTEKPIFQDAKKKGRK